MHGLACPTLLGGYGMGHFDPVSLLERDLVRHCDLTSLSASLLHGPGYHLLSQHSVDSSSRVFLT